jgi:hypothetical protein
MIGVGAIYDAYRRGELDGDDEVAIAHGDSSHDFAPASEAMVNIRATLAKAMREAVISADTFQRIQNTAKLLYYPDRAWPTILALARRTDLPDNELIAST